MLALCINLLAKIERKLPLKKAINDTCNDTNASDNK
jgi:hypothetical protein